MSSCKTHNSKINAGMFRDSFRYSHETHWVFCSILLIGTFREITGVYLVILWE